MMMALAWAERSAKPGPPALEFQLWREATTIFAGSGPGGCEPFGVAVALRRRGLRPEIYVSRPGPYFVDAVRSAEGRRVMAFKTNSDRTPRRKMAFSTISSRRRAKSCFLKCRLITLARETHVELSPLESPVRPASDGRWGNRRVGWH